MIITHRHMPPASIEIIRPLRASGSAPRLGDLSAPKKFLIVSQSFTLCFEKFSKKIIVDSKFIPTIAPSNYLKLSRMKTRKVQITYLSNENSELGSVIQVMSEETIGKWISFLLDMKYSLISVKDVD